MASNIDQVSGGMGRNVQATAYPLVERPGAVDMMDLPHIETVQHLSLKPTDPGNCLFAGQQAL